MKKMKIYISGKIGEEVISDATRQKFAKAEEMLKANGFEVFNPCDENWQAHLNVRYMEDSKIYQPYIDGGIMPDFYSYVLLRDLMSISTKDGVYMLKDWRQSPGATAEYEFAVATGKIIMFE